ncbi:hypothetical protein KY285_024080 [Solanum tuberosum]|nr:hypothetical protein KY285_024080 [Solanum tuberosum]
MDQHYPTNGSSTLSYQWINITPPTDLHYHYLPIDQHYPTSGSTLPHRQIFIIIFLPMDQHYPTNGSILSYRRTFFIIIIILPTDLYYHHHINGSSSVLSYQWIIVNHHLSMEHYHPIDEVASSYRWINITLPMDYCHSINEASLSYQ